jgi:hypothetical protein
MGGGPFGLQKRRRRPVFWIARAALLGVQYIYLRQLALSPYRISERLRRPLLGRWWKKTTYIHRNVLRRAMRPAPEELGCRAMCAVLDADPEGTHRDGARESQPFLY